MAVIYDVTDEEMNSLTQSILTRYGIDFTCYEPKSLRRRIIRVLNLFDLQSIHDLWLKFLKDPNFVHVFMNEISVGMTSMFRDPILWVNLKSRLANEFKSRYSLSIWHAGCSTGEEVYSLGILLSEINLRQRAKALATDFNRNALQEAQDGIFHKIKMIENENNYRDYNPANNFDNYFTPNGKYVQMNRDLISHATFQYQNLITDTYPSGFDLIFCRNVMIYFDSIAKNKVVDKFYNSLNSGGYLIIGFFDTISHMIDGKKFRIVDEAAKIFQKV